MPALDRLQGERGTRDFEVVALSIDREGLPAVEAFFRQMEIRYLQVYVDPSGSASSTFAVSAIPTTLLIDTEGRELARSAGPRDWDNPRVIDFLNQSFGLEDRRGQSGTGKTAPVTR